MQALLPALASMSSQPPAWKAGTAQVDPGQNGQQAQQALPPPDNAQSGSQVLDMLSKLGQPQSQSAQQTPAASPAPSGSAASNAMNSSGIGSFLMQLFSQHAGGS